jgi:hypothetical protein
MNGLRHAARLRLKKHGFTALFALILTGVLALVALKHHTLAGLREQNRALGQRVEQLQRLETENLRLYRLVGELRPGAPDRLLDELAALRREADRLRGQKEQWEKLCAENRQLRSELGGTVRPPVSQDAWTYVGYGDPELACQSYFWASVSGDPKVILDTLCPEARASWGQCSEEEIAAAFANMEKVTRKSPSYQILGQKKISDDEIELIMTVRPDRSDIENLRMTFKRAGAEWRFYGHFHHF